MTPCEVCQYLLKMRSTESFQKAAGIRIPLNECTHLGDTNTGGLS